MPLSPNCYSRTRDRTDKTSCHSGATRRWLDTKDFVYVYMYLIDEPRQFNWYVQKVNLATQRDSKALRFHHAHGGWHTGRQRGMSLQALSQNGRYQFSPLLFHHSPHSFHSEDHNPMFPLSCARVRWAHTRKLGAHKFSLENAFAHYFQRCRSKYYMSADKMLHTENFVRRQTFKKWEETLLVISTTGKKVYAKLITLASCPEEISLISSHLRCHVT